MFEPRLNKDGSKTIRVINVRRCAVNWFNESIPEAVFDELTQIDVKKFMQIFEKYHEDFKTFGWILEIANPYKNITET